MEDIPQQIPHVTLVGQSDRDDVSDVVRDKGEALHDRFPNRIDRYLCGDDVRDRSERKNKNNLPRKRKFSQGEGEDVTPARKMRSTPLVASSKKKPEIKSKLKSNKKINVITNHFKPSSIAVQAGGEARGDRGGVGDAEGGEAVPRTCAVSGTGRSEGGKTMRLVKLEMIGQGLSAAGIQTNTGAGDRSADWDDTSLGQCAQLKEK